MLAVLLRIMDMRWGGYCEWYAGNITLDQLQKGRPGAASTGMSGRIHVQQFFRIALFNRWCSSRRYFVRLT